jgi:hypothetical protein
MSNVLPRSKQVAVIAALTEGCSLRCTSRMTGVDRETVGTLLARVGEGCEALMNDTMVNLPCARLELDELWAFVGKKARHVKEGDDASVGDTWTWLAIDADTKLVPSFLVGKRTDADARALWRTSRSGSRSACSSRRTGSGRTSPRSASRLERPGWTTPR